MMMTPSTPGSRRGFSLIELLLAIFILGIGIISIAAVFPAGIIQQRRAQDDVLGPVVAEEALAVIRSKVSPDDFGTFEEFGILGAGNFRQVDSTPNLAYNPSDTQTGYRYEADRYTVPGDFPWLRPSMYVAQPDTVIGTGTDHVYGDIDIFSARVLHQFGSNNNWTGTDPVGQKGPSDTNFKPYTGGMGWTDSQAMTSEFLTLAGSIGFPVVGDTHPSIYSPPGGVDPDGLRKDWGAFLFGIPFNRSKYDPVFGKPDPLATITQEERFWPLGSGYGSGEKKPQYAWECMFRRHQGRVQVAIFVYRVAAANAVGGYAAVAYPAGLGNAQYRPPLPTRFDIPYELDASSYPELRPLTPLGAADADGDGVQDEQDASYLRAEVVGTNPSDLPLSPYELGWQAPGQWILDAYGRTHRVVQGRRNNRQGPVRLARPVPEQSQTSSSWNWAVQGQNPADDANQGIQNEVRSIWFIPPVDERGITLTPVYMTVREL
ncbi:MAG: prepilin-type N-terminal cleavage/methylation domain-containing protein [Phycisphaerales bacterium]|nr:prepilin-type N-terminal cleavage/methylation domain-containing protein [Phycisphaerales bacterium]